MGAIKVTSIDNITGNYRVSLQNISLTLSEKENLKLEDGKPVEFFDPKYGRIIVNTVTSNHRQLKDRRYVQPILIPSRNHKLEGYFILVETNVPKEARESKKVSMNGSYPSLDYVIEKDKLYN